MPLASVTYTRAQPFALHALSSIASANCAINFTPKLSYLWFFLIQKQHESPKSPQLVWFSKPGDLPLSPLVFSFYLTFSPGLQSQPLVIPFVLTFGPRFRSLSLLSPTYGTTNLALVDLALSNLALL